MKIWGFDKVVGWGLSSWRKPRLASFPEQSREMKLHSILGTPWAFGLFCSLDSRESLCCSYGKGEEDWSQMTCQCKLLSHAESNGRAWKRYSVFLWNDLSRSSSPSRYNEVSSLKKARPPWSRRIYCRHGAISGRLGCDRSHETHYIKTLTLL